MTEHQDDTGNECEGCELDMTEQQPMVMRLSCKIAQALASTGMVSCQLATLPGELCGIVGFGTDIAPWDVMKQMHYVRHGIPPLATCMLVVGHGNVAIIVQKTSVDFARLVWRLSEDVIRSHGIPVAEDAPRIIMTSRGPVELDRGEPN